MHRINNQACFGSERGKPCAVRPAAIVQTDGNVLLVSLDYYEVVRKETFARRWKAPKPPCQHRGQMKNAEE